jgi:hypothetical protein
VEAVVEAAAATETYAPVSERKHTAIALEFY